MDEIKKVNFKLPGPIELLQKSFAIFFDKKNLLYFVKIYAILLPFYIFNLFQNQYIQNQAKLIDKSNPAELFKIGAPFLGINLIVGLASLVLSFWVYAAGIIALKKVIDGGDRNVRATLKEAWQKLWPFSLISILMGLSIIFGFLLLIIPGIVFGIWFGFSEYVFFDQGIKGVDALRKSKELVKGYFWPIVGRMVICGLAFIILGGIVGAVPYLGSILVSMSGVLTIIPSYLLYKELVSGHNSA